MGAFSSTWVSSVVVPKTVQKVVNSFACDTHPIRVDINTERLKYIEGGAFNRVDFANTKIVLSDGCVIKEDDFDYGHNCDVFSESNITSIVLPEGLERIPERMFQRCSKLKSVTLPSTLKEIGEYAFYDCTSLESITFPNSLQKIGVAAFMNCENLKEVNIPDGAEYKYDSAGVDGAFAGCINFKLKTKAAIRATGYVKEFD